MNEICYNKTQMNNRTYISPAKSWNTDAKESIHKQPKQSIETHILNLLRLKAAGPHSVGIYPTSVVEGVG
jgi:hypothetical protein